MKKFFIYFSISFVISFFIFFSLSYFNFSKEIDTKQDNLVTSLKDEYNNDEVVGVLEIPDVFKTVIVKHNDNEFYLNHDISKKESKLGSVFMDYRNSLDDKKILIYGHNSTRGNKLPFTYLDKYIKKSYYQKHPYFYFYSDKKYIYDIFSVYVESEDFDYVNLDNYNGLTYLEHINKLKNKSIYNTGISLNDDSKIMILQTCNVESGYDGSYKNTLVIGVLREE